MMKRFKKRSDLVKQAVKNVTERQNGERKKHMNAMQTAGDFLQQCAMKLRRSR
jgi:Arc/MetJ-type ribon-helix-helix transcriptional regulator